MRIPVDDLQSEVIARRAAPRRADDNNARIHPFGDNSPANENRDSFSAKRAAVSRNSNRSSLENSFALVCSAEQ